LKHGCANEKFDGATDSTDCGEYRQAAGAFAQGLMLARPRQGDRPSKGQPGALKQRLAEYGQYDTATYKG